MKKKPLRPVVLTFVVIAGVALATVLMNWLGPRDRIPWRLNYLAAVDESHRTGKPMLMDFSADWCGPCQEMGTSTWSDKSVEAAVRDYVPVRIDFDKNAELDHRFMADETGIPLMVVLDSSGTPVKAHVGYLDAGDFLAWLKAPASQVPLATAPATNPG